MTYGSAAALRALAVPCIDLAEHDVEPYRGHLFNVAYRLLRDSGDAEDMVQDAYLRWHRASGAERAAVSSPEGWLVTVVSRLAIDRIRRTRTERRALGMDHGLASAAAAAANVANRTDATDHEAELASDLSAALGILLERLGPEERAALLLRDVFDAEYDEIAQRLGRTEVAVRQVIHRARARLQRDRARFTVSPDTRARLAGRFRAALAADDRDAVLALFTTSADGGAMTASAPPPSRSTHVTRGPLDLERHWCGRLAHDAARAGEQTVADVAAASYCPVALRCPSEPACSALAVQR